MKTSYRLLVAILLVAVPFIAWHGGSAAQGGPNNPSSETQGQGAGQAEKFRRVGKPFRDHYIVVLKNDTPREDVEGVANQLLAKHGGTTRYIYKSAIKGFSIQMPEAAAMALSRNPQVAYVQEDGQVFLDKTQTNAPWGIDRIDQREPPRSFSYSFPNVNTGAGVHAYVIDSGIQTTHTEFLKPNGASRAVRDVDFMSWDFQNGNDCAGHGTAVASVIGGNTVGVAKDVTLHAVRVFSCADWTLPSVIIAGVDWVKDHHQLPAVVNMSLHIPWADYALEDAIRNTMAAGITFAVAAGNSNEDASGISPARMPEVITVGATMPDDTRAEFSNFGASLDLFAPGAGIPTADNDDANGNGVLDDVIPQSGTSFSAPHVAGVAARFLQLIPSATPAAVQGAIESSATPNKVKEPGAGSPNLVLYSEIHTQLARAGNVAVVPESATFVDSGVDVGPNEWLSMTGSGEIWAGAASPFNNGPQGWNSIEDSPAFPLPGSRPFSLLGNLDAQNFYIGKSNAATTNFSSPKRLFLRTNDDVPGNGSGLFHCDIEVWKKVPDVSADFISQSVPTMIVAGQTASVSITMKNVGPTTWRASELYRLGSSNDLTWGVGGRVSVPATVVPGQTWTFTFDMIAPSTPGTYNFQWRMLQELVQWFGDLTPNAPITVLATSNQAEFVSQVVPKSMFAGSQYNASVTMKNVGNTTWQTGANYWLGSQNSQDNMRWGMNRVVLPHPVPPGSQVTFNFVVTAPLNSGTYNFQWRMVQDGVEWFGATTPNAIISVKPVCNTC